MTHQPTNPKPQPRPKAAKAVCHDCPFRARFHSFNARVATRASSPERRITALIIGLNIIETILLLAK